MIRRYAESVDVVVVPWSEGKDSTLVLHLASKAVPQSRLRAVFADTGLEFPQTLEFAEMASRALGVRVEKVYAGSTELLRAAHRFQDPTTGGAQPSRSQPCPPTSSPSSRRGSES